MKIKEVTDILKFIGWQTYIDIGDRYAHFQLPDRTVEIFYGIHRATKYQKFGADLSLSTDEFSSVCSQIRNKHDDYMPLIRSWTGLDIRDPEMIKEEHIYQASQMAIDWAKEQDLHQGLLDLAALPTDAFGLHGIWHISALALLGDIEKLKFYQASFESGDRLDFSHSVTKDCIDRAVAIAKQHMIAD